MKNVRIVIGSSYGDEGKGNATNYLATDRSAVVRFNGGAQAGHTVEHDGIRHVFHNFGSGTLKGVPTILGPKFAIDPVMFFWEAESLPHDLIQSNNKLKVFADPDCPIVTPYDIVLNQAIERKRDDKHGSCGMGFGETIRRNIMGYEFTLKDASNAENMCDSIESWYFRPRVAELGLDVNDDELMDMLDVFYTELQSLTTHIETVAFKDIEDEFEALVFEGAQGLCLDQHSKDYPHVTFSNTGLDNVVELLDPRKHKLDVHYITRPYLTRHGAGELKDECEKPESVVDETNIDNEFQGSLRFAPLNLDRMRRDIQNDLVKAHRFEFDVKLMITCCDQVEADHQAIADAVGIENYETCWSAAGDWRAACVT